MGRERELLESLKESTTATAQEVSDSVGFDNAVSVLPSSESVRSLSAMDYVYSFGDSLATDPLFYLKTGLVVVLACVILFFAIDLIFGG